VETLRGFLLRRSHPRVEVAFMLVLTGVAGFLASALLLHAGVGSMVVRYPLAVLVAYGAFLLLLRGWIRGRLGGRGRSVIDRSDLAEVVDVVPSGVARASTKAAESVFGGFGGGRFGGGGAGGAFVAPDVLGSAASSTTKASASVVGEVLDSDDVWPIALVVGLVVAAAAGFALAVWAAPVLLAEVLLDAMLVGGIARRLRGIEPRHWTIGVLRRTCLPVLSIVVLLAGAGWLMQSRAPEAQSLGEFLAAARE
jgi:hypothetical protein